MPDLVNDLLNALLELSTAEPFDTGARCQEIVEHIAQTSKDQNDPNERVKWFQETFGPDNFVPVLPLLDALRVASMAMSMSQSLDPKGFWRTVDQVRKGA